MVSRLTSEPLPFRQRPAVGRQAATFLTQQDRRVLADLPRHRGRHLHEFRGQCEPVGAEA